MNSLAMPRGNRAMGFLSWRRQEGSILILSAAVMLSVLLVTALAVDLGRIFWEKRRLQMVADLAALEASLATVSCPQAGSGTPLQLAQAAAIASALRNGYQGSPSQIEVQVGKVTTNNSGVRSFVPSSSSTAAVQVRVEHAVPRSLLIPGHLLGDATLQATAVAGAGTVGTLQAGSFLARLDTNSSPLLNALLGKLLRTSINLDVASYRGLANANVTLLDLLEVSTDVGTVDQLLNLDLGIRDFVLLGAKALSRYPDQATVAATLLNLADVIAVDIPLHLRLGDLLEVDLPDRRAALNAKINVLQLLMLGAQVANAHHLVQVDLGTNLLKTIGVADVGLDLYIIDPPRIAVGPAGRDESGEWITRVTSAQINLQLHLSLLDILTLKPKDGIINLDVFVQAPVTRAGFERFECFRDGYGAVVGYVAQAVRIGVGKFDDLSKRNPKVLPSHVLYLPPHLLGIKASADLGLGNSPEKPGELVFDRVPETLSVDNDALGHAISNLLGSLVKNLKVEFEKNTILGFVLGVVLDPILKLLGLGDANGLLDYLHHYLLGPVLSGLDILLDPLLHLLGLSVAGADITVLDVSPGRPSLLL